MYQYDRLQGWVKTTNRVCLSWEPIHDVEKQWFVAISIGIQIKAGIYVTRDTVLIDAVRAAVRFHSQLELSTELRSTVVNGPI